MRSFKNIFFKMQNLIKFIILSTTFLNVCFLNAQDNSKSKIHYIENCKMPYKGFLLPWVKTCQTNLTQINKAILVNVQYERKIDENIINSNFLFGNPICDEQNMYICRVTVLNVIKILGKV